MKKTFSEFIEIMDVIKFPRDAQMEEFQKAMSDAIDAKVQARAAEIDRLFLDHVPRWQVRAMTLFPILKRFFDYELRSTVRDPNRIGLYKRGKLVCDASIQLLNNQSRTL